MCDTIPFALFFFPFSFSFFQSDDSSQLSVECMLGSLIEKKKKKKKESGDLWRERDEAKGLNIERGPFVALWDS